MKRPRWLGSGESKEEGQGDDDSVAESSAAERSARRTARRALADRVADSGKESPAEKPNAKAKPKDAPEPKTKPKAKAEPKAKSETADSEPKAKDKPKAKAGPEAKKLHRPRPQKDRSRGDSGDGSKSGGRTERGSKRDEESEEKRKPLGSRVRGAGVASAKALREGAVATRKQAAESAPKLGRRIVAGLAAIFAVFFAILGFVLRILIAIAIVVGRPIRWFLIRLRRATDVASRIATPVRVLALVVAGAAVLLALSQYADYRSISIGNDAYSGVQTVAPAPETARLPTGDAHSYVFVPIAVVCLILLGAALTGRWRLCRLISLAGVAAIVVAIVVDRPAGLDTGDTALAFEGVRATLIGGFYAQIAAGVLLIGSSALLGRELRLAGATERAKPERGRSRRARRSAATPPAGTAGTGGVRA